MSTFDDNEIERVRERIRARRAALTENFRNVQHEVRHKVESVKQSLDVTRPIRRNPTGSVLASLAAGLAIGIVAGGRARRHRHELELARSRQSNVAQPAVKAGLVTGLVLPLGIAIAKRIALSYVDTRLLSHSSSADAGSADAGSGYPSGRGGGGFDLSSLHLPFFKKKSAAPGYSAHPTTCAGPSSAASEPYFDGYPPGEPNPAANVTKPAFGARHYDGSR